MRHDGHGIDIKNMLLKLINPTGLIEDPPMYKNEIHAKGYNFLGPGTDLKARRINKKNFIPIDDLDKAAMKHDLSYEKINKDVADGVIDKKKALENAHISDAEFIDELKKIKGFSLTKILASKAILLKRYLEAKSLLNPEVFSLSGSGVDYNEISKKIILERKIFDPAHRLRKKKKIGGFAIIPFLTPVIVGILADIAVDAGKAIYHKITDKKGSGLQSNDEIIKKIIHELDDMSYEKQINKIHDIIYKKK